MTNMPLSGIKVLDLARVLAGPSATQLLADLGADVVKVERPTRGDDSRLYGPPFLKASAGDPTPNSAMYLSANRNKRSIAVNIATPEGQSIIRDLAAVSDVLVENFKVGDLARYGLDYATLSAINPKLIYCSVTGYGQTGPYRFRGGYDPIAQAMSGFMSITGFPDEQAGGAPMKAGPSVADLVAGLYAANAIQAALYHRDVNRGGGQHIDISLLDTTIAVMAQPAIHYFISGTPPGRVGTQANGGAPGGGFRCSDGYIMIAPGNQALYEKFCTAIGRPDLATDERFLTNPLRLVNRAVLAGILDEVLGALTVAEVHASLVAAGVPSSPINDMAQVFADEQVKARALEVEVAHQAAGSMKMVGNPIKFSQTPIENYLAPPQIGQHTDEVLREWLGLSAQVANSRSES